jgi:hypothetical protein
MTPLGMVWQLTNYSAQNLVNPSPWVDPRRDDQRDGQPRTLIAAHTRALLAREWLHGFGKSIRTISEFSRERSNTMNFPSGVTSNVCRRP